MFLIGVWLVSIITGIYEPESEPAHDEELAPEADHNNDDVGPVPESDGDADIHEDNLKTDEENTNNNANSQYGDVEESKVTDGTDIQNVDKYKVSPKPPSCQLVLVVYGQNGKTQQLPLVAVDANIINMFQPGQTAKFKVGFLSFTLVNFINKHLQ